MNKREREHQEGTWVTRATAMISIAIIAKRVIKISSSLPTALSRSCIECSIDICSRWKSLKKKSEIEIRPLFLEKRSLQAGHLHFFSRDISVWILIKKCVSSIRFIFCGEQRLDVLYDKKFPIFLGKWVEKTSRELYQIIITGKKNKHNYSEHTKRVFLADSSAVLMTALGELGCKTELR